MITAAMLIIVTRSLNEMGVGELVSISGCVSYDNDTVVEFS